MVALSEHRTCVRVGIALKQMNLRCKDALCRSFLCTRCIEKHPCMIEKMDNGNSCRSTYMCANTHTEKPWIQGSWNGASLAHSPTHSLSLAPSQCAAALPSDLQQGKLEPRAYIIRSVQSGLPGFVELSIRLRPTFNGRLGFKGLMTVRRLGSKG